MRSTFFLFIAIICFLNARAQQSFTISGTVEDLKGRKLPGAGVYISGSRFATSTNNNGSYSLTLTPGSYELGVKMIGFETKVVKIVISSQSEKMDFKLVEQITNLAEVTISNRPANSKYVSQFTELFIGTTPNAQLCHISNPEVLVFDYDRVRSKLSAHTTDFLVIENKALGYRIKYIVETFVYDEEKKSISYKGSSYFEELEGTVIEQKKWNLNRLMTYYGSPRHFFTNLYRGEVEKDGFFIAKITNKPNADRPPDSLIKSNIKRLMLSKQTESGLVDFSKGDSLSYWMKQKEKPLFSAELVAKQILTDTLVHDAGNQLKKISFKDQLYVVYKKDREDPLYKNSLNPFLIKVLNMPKTQMSMIMMLEDEATFSSNGNLANPQSMFFSGYWGWKNVADSLPSDYIPVAM
ncbi:carboxypeptidase-like regulatory domain-containing protein [Pedobacter boryungensis]|uniref:Carboxypeptidase-like regulatory domain-containing protein n=1 Tax=Pedobacter boryungensis TaxID=869962 RepID=A0ABX2DCX8_9SPHI|nr:carboxypeptidase-like regulatory domain-containing protein [Pedobacter boryungensis]NQX31887.1 carboxypeptidase-like regulatory domain-containing protein [Pedobacter boryungensis]